MLERILAVGAILLLLPLCIPIAAAIKLTSPGPSLCRHERAGLHGRSVWVHTFRTTAGSRLTPIGRYLRDRSLQELPQIWDVVRGEIGLWELVIRWLR